MGNDYKELKEVFYTDYNKKKYGYRQRKAYSPIRLADPFRMEKHGMYACFSSEFMKE